MKTLFTLLILLACQISYGQMKPEMEALLDTTHCYIDGFEEYGEFTNKEYIELKVTKLFIELCNGYQKECFADSSEYIDRSCPDHIIGCCVNHFRTIWIHREPTFEGFMEFMIKKHIQSMIESKLENMRKVK